MDTELLARLESGTSDKIRVTLPNKKINEMFAIADQILGGRRVRSVCEDGETRLSRIPGKMRRRQWVREGDLIVICLLYTSPRPRDQRGSGVPG